MTDETSRKTERFHVRPISQNDSVPFKVGASVGNHRGRGGRYLLLLLGWVFLWLTNSAAQEQKQPGPSSTPSWEFQPKPGMDQPYIPSWRIVGPFAWTEPAVEATSTDHSEAIARQLDHPFLPQLKAEGGSNEYLPATEAGLQAKVVNTTNGLIRLHTVLTPVRYQVAYAECDVVSALDQDAVLLPESDDGIKIWLNGEVVVRIDAIRQIIPQFEGHVRVRLRKGSNHILLKLARTRQTSIWDPWDFAVGLRSIEGALDEIAGRGVPPFFPNTIIKIGAPLSVDLTLFPANEKVSLVLSQSEKERRFDLSGGGTSSISMTDFLPGPVDAMLRSGHHEFAEPILYGSVEEFAAKYRGLLPTYYSDPRHKANLGALLIRFEHLLEPSHSENDNQLWQKKIAQLCWQIERITADIRAGREPYRGKAGTWLRGYSSKLDGGLQYYIVHAPPQAESGRPFPLVIELPYEEQPLRPYLYSVPVAQYSDLKLHDRAADRNGFGYLWLNNRGNTYGQDFGMTELFTALAEVQRDYAIDPDRIHLFGGCTGGLHALALADDHPDLFAAIGVVTPIARYRRVTVFDPPSPTDAYACSWLRERSPVERMENLLNVPILSIHGDEDTHNSISQTRDLETAAHAASAPFTFSVAHGGTALRWPEEPLYSTFDFFRIKSRARSPEHVNFTARSEKDASAYWLKIESFADRLKPARIEGRLSFDGTIAVQTTNVASFSILVDKIDPRPAKVVVTTNGKISFSGSPTGPVLRITNDAASSSSQNAELPGPISDAFTEPFLVVIGTQGSEAVANETQVHQFLKTWLERFFTDARSKPDTEVSDADIRNYNLILFGTTQSNRILQRIAGSLPLHYSKDGVSLGGRNWQGRGYSIQAVFPNPLEPSRYVVLAGDPGCTKCPADARQFALHGWYDAVVWQMNDNGSVRMVDVGRFDGAWQNFVPAQACH